MAAVQALATAIALAARLGAPYDGPLKTVLLNGSFVACLLALAWLFRHPTRE